MKNAELFWDILDVLTAAVIYVALGLGFLALYVLAANA